MFPVFALELKLQPSLYWKKANTYASGYVDTR